MKIIKDTVPYNSNNPFARIHTKILNDVRISPLAFRLLCVLVNCNQRTYKPTIKSLSKQFKVDTRTIDRAVAELKSYGYITSSGTMKNTVWNIHPITLTT